MGADFSRIRSNPLLDFAGVELKQGARPARCRLQRAGGDHRPAPARAGQRHPRPQHGVVDDARRVQDHASRRARCRSARAGSTSTACSPRTMARASDRSGEARLRPAAGRAAVSPIRSPTTPSPTCRTPPALPTAGRHLVYLDVWNREVTHLERPDLVESAVGVETSSRLQTVWQVRVLDRRCRRRPTCASPDDDVPGWCDAHRAVDRAAHDRHLRRRAGGRPVRAAADRRLPRPREPDSTASKSTTPASPAPAPRSSGRARTPASAAASRA